MMRLVSFLHYQHLAKSIWLKALIIEKYCLLQLAFRSSRRQYTRFNVVNVDSGGIGRNVINKKKKTKQFFIIMKAMLNRNLNKM